MRDDLVFDIDRALYRYDDMLFYHNLSVLEHMRKSLVAAESYGNRAEVVDESKNNDYAASIPYRVAQLEYTNVQHSFHYILGLAEGRITRDNSLLARSHLYSSQIRQQSEIFCGLSNVALNAALSEPGTAIKRILTNRRLTEAVSKI